MADVSVIIANYNRAHLLEKAVRSALSQTVPVCEVLVCDDGSTDRSEEAMRSLGDDRVRWLPGPRAGRPAIPRNRGIRESRGEWLAFLDNDDEWLPEKLARQLEKASVLKCAAACGNAMRFVPGQGMAGRYLALEAERVTFDDLLRVNQVICSSALVHRSLFPAVAGFPEDERLRALEDYALWLRVATLTDFAYDPEPQVVYLDDSAGSIRRGGGDVWSQRQVVFGDFTAWGERGGAAPELLAKVRGRLRKDRLDRLSRTVVDPIVRLKKSFLP